MYKSRFECTLLLVIAFFYSNLYVHRLARGGGMVDYKNRSSYLGLYWMVLVQVVILTSWAAVHHR